MNIKKLCLTVAATLLVAGAAQAQTENSPNQKYFGNEFSFDAFGGYTKSFQNADDIFDHSWRHGNFGGGVGLNYFFIRYVGVGADTFFQSHGEFFSNASGHLILRLPIGPVAPYVFGGGGGRFDPVDEWIYDAGVGLEFRFTRHVGLFVDGRYAWAEKTSDSALVRAGLRFAF